MPQDWYLHRSRGVERLTRRSYTELSPLIYIILLLQVNRITQYNPNILCIKYNFDTLHTCIHRKRPRARTAQRDAEAQITCNLHQRIAWSNILITTASKLPTYVSCVRLLFFFFFSIFVECCSEYHWTFTRIAYSYPPPHKCLKKC